MKLNITGEKVKVYRKDRVSNNGSPFTTYFIKISQKSYKSDEWLNAFVGVRFKKGEAVSNKSEITVKNAFPVLSKWGDKTEVQLMITDYEVTSGATNITDDGFMEIDDMEDTPFE